MKNPKKISFSCSVLFLGLLFTAFLPKDKPVYVAEFGKHKITLDEFKFAYINLIKKPKVFDSKDLREEFLDELIFNVLLAEEAGKLKLDQNDLVEYKIESYKKKLLREAHFDAKIKTKISPSENEIEDAYQFLQEERKVSHLFFDSKEKADSVYKLLFNGSDWNLLSKNIFKDSALANSGGNLGWVFWDQLDYDLGNAAYKVKPNEFSQPVKSNFGYHIVKVTDYKKKPMITRSEYEIHRRKAKAILQFKIGDKLSNDYINDLVKKAKIKIIPEVFQFVINQLKEKFTRKPNQMNPMSDIQLNDEEIKNIKTNLWDERHQTLATINGNKFTVGDLLTNISYVPYEVIYSSARKTIDYSLRDYLITKEAEKLGLEKTEFVKVKTQLFKNSLLALEYRKSFVSNILLKEEDILNYYRKNSESYKNTEYEKVKDVIGRLVLEDKKRSSIANLKKELFAKYKIKKNLNPINTYYDAILNTKG